MKSIREGVSFANFSHSPRHLGRSWRVGAWHTMPLSRKYRKRRRRTSGLRKNSGHRRSSMKRPVRMSTAGCRTSGIQRWTVS
jgi:hypothetical protein